MMKFNKKDFVKAKVHAVKVHPAVLLFPDFDTASSLIVFIYVFSTQLKHYTATHKSHVDQ